MLNSMKTNFSFSKMELISSESNPKFKIWSSLLSSKGRKKEGLFILSGEKVILDFLNSDAFSRFSLKAVLVPNKEDFASNSILTLLQQKLSQDAGSNLKNLFFRLETALIEKLDTIGTHHILLVLETPSLPELSLPHPPEGLEVVCPVGDPNNLGALIRSALAFGVRKIILTKNSSDPFNQKTIKSSSGAVLSAPLARLNKALNEVSSSELSNADLGLDLQGQEITQFSWPENCRLWLGEEGPGLRIIPPSQCLHIPISQIESLNVSIAGSISFFSYRSHQLRKSSGATK